MLEMAEIHRVMFNPIVFVRIITKNARRYQSYNDPIAKLAVTPARSILKRKYLVEGEQRWKKSKGFFGTMSIDLFVTVKNLLLMFRY